jgi:uncharacterized protein YndB with AHSA1/START domain
MFEVSESVTINTPAERLFGIAADPEVQLRWDAGTLRRVEKLSDGPLGAGARYRGAFKGFGTVDYEFAEYDPGRRFSHDARLPIGRMHHVFEFEPDGAATRLTQRIQVSPGGFGRVVAPLMRPMLRRRIRQIDKELKQFAESS